MPDSTWVWLWSARGVEDSSIDELGYSIGSFMEYALHSPAVIYFHNLKFDGQFIIHFLLSNGWEHSFSDVYELSPGQFTTIISDMGQFYKIAVRGSHGLTEFLDSYKKIPLTVAAMARAYGLDMSKGDLDYKALHYPDSGASPDEIDYVRRDTGIVAEVLRQQFENGLTCMTSSSDALKEYKRCVREDFDGGFRSLFPELSIEEDRTVRAAYRGGFTYADSRTAGRIVGAGIVLDVNSLYPSVMRFCQLPMGDYSPVDTLPADDTLYIATFNFSASLKSRGIPCIQLRRSSRFSSTEYQSVIPVGTSLTLTSVDWKLINDMYDVDLVSVSDIITFESRTGFFDTYIDKWMEVKANSTGGKRQIAKLMLNSLYGKFASRTQRVNKYPTLEDGRVVMKTHEGEEAEPVYTPMGTFITAWARDKTIRSAAANYDRFLYADTDSLHLLGTEPPVGLEIHESRLGAWKIEGTFDRGIFVRAKQYCEEKDGVPDCHIAGLPRKLATEISPDDLLSPQRWYGKLVPKTIKGGVFLKETHFTFTPVERNTDDV